MFHSQTTDSSGKVGNIVGKSPTVEGGVLPEIIKMGLISDQKSPVKVMGLPVFIFPVMVLIPKIIKAKSIVVIIRLI